MTTRGYVYKTEKGRKAAEERAKQIPPLWAEALKRTCPRCRAARGEPCTPPRWVGRPHGERLALVFDRVMAS